MPLSQNKNDLNSLPLEIHTLILCKIINCYLIEYI